jgi:hypothetical protein
MQTFIFHNEAGQEIDRINVADRAAAELYRYQHGYIGSPQPVIEPETGPLAPGQKITRADATESLRESFRAIGLSDSAAETAARGREGPVIPRGNFAESLHESFRAIGLSESAATLAARGHYPGIPIGLRAPAAPAGKPPTATGTLRESPAGVAGVIDLRETTPLEQAFRALGLSESAARIAARGRER